VPQFVQPAFRFPAVGGADSCVALATAKLSDLLGYIRKCPAPPA
jgi:hypothetical protein